MHLRPLALSIVALLATAPAALALDANDFAAKLTKTWTGAAAGITLKFGAPTVAGNNVSFAGVTLTSPAAASPPISSDVVLTFTNVQQQADGGYIADSLTVPDNDFKFDGGDVSVKNVVLHHLFVPGGEPGPADSSRLFGDVSVGPIVLTIDGTPAFSLNGITVTNNFKPSQSDANLAEINSTAVTDGMKFDLSQSKDQDALAQAKALDLVTLNGKALETASWTLADGHLNISEVSLDVEKVGKIKFAFDMTGYTPAFVKTLGTVMQTMGEAAGTSAKPGAQQAATATLLASLQSLFLNSSSLRFDDASITNKVLDMLVKQAGVDKAKFIDALVAQVPASMAEGESNPPPIEVIKMVQAASRAYLNDPHSIEVRLAPKAPLGILGIVAAAMAPANVADQIGLKVLVNDKEITAEDAAKETGIAAPAADTSTTTPSDDSSTTPSTDSSTSTDNSTSTDSSTSTDDSTTSSDDNSSGDQTSTDSSDDSSGSRLTTRHNH